MSFAERFRQVYGSSPSLELTDMTEPNPEGSSTSMTATTDPPKPKPSPKLAASTEHGDSAATTQKQPRVYRITKTLTLDLTDPMSLVQQLQSVAGGDPENPEPVVVDVRVGTGKGGTPKAAIEDYAQNNEVNGDYEVVAEASIKSYPGLKTKRTVSFS